MHHSVKIPVRYAKALMMAAKEAGRIDVVYDDLMHVSELLESVPEVMNLLNDPVIRSSIKIKILKNFLENKITIETLNLIILLISNKREKHFPEILKVFKVLYKHDKGIKEITLKSTFAPDSEMTLRFEELLRKNLKSDVEITNVIDKSLIGGFTIRVDDLLYDASVKTQLKRIKEKMTEKTDL